MKQGKLYIVATPIGNMEDITIRAIKTLESCDFIISEDTRETGKILQKMGISKTMLNYRDDNHDIVYSDILGKINSGLSCCLVSDSGTPLISDPGYKLVKDLLSNNIEIISIPGASSVISSLVVSGLPTDKFTFLGFLSKNPDEQIKTLEKYKDIDSTLIIFESQFRLVSTLENIYKILGDRFCALVNEQTKVHEKVYRDTVKNIANSIKSDKLRGEFVVLIAKEGYKNG